MITEEYLKEIEARANAAFSGPWVYDNRYGDRGCVRHKFTNIPITDVNLQHPGMDTACVKKADGKFIAAAREDILRLIAEIRALWQELKE